MPKCTSFNCHADAIPGKTVCEKHKAQDIGKGKGASFLVHSPEKEKAGKYDQEARKREEERKAKQALDDDIYKKGGVVDKNVDLDEDDWDSEDEDPHAAGKQKKNIKEVLLKD
eukprot:g19204.t1